MARNRERRYEIEDLVSRPGTYFNPQTEVLVVVDDSAAIDAEIFNMEEFEGADWVLVSDDVPIDESARDEILENFQSTHSGDGRAVPDEDYEDELDEDEEEEERYDEEDDDYGDDEDE